MDLIDQKWYSLEDSIIRCQKCPRLVAWRQDVARTKRKAYRDWEYWGKPIPAFGDPHGRVLVVGLAPAAHGGNRTGRAFTGDSSGDFLYRALYQSGFASQPTSDRREDGLELSDLLITAVCRCAPPDNKPLPQEIQNCLPYLEQEIAFMDRLQVVVALGRIAFDAVLRLAEKGVFGEKSRFQKSPEIKFGHGNVYKLGEGLPWLVVSYHPSRQNTQTGRLTPEMFDEIWLKTKTLIQG